MAEAAYGANVQVASLDNLKVYSNTLVELPRLSDASIISNRLLPYKPGLNILEFHHENQSEASK